MEITWQEIAKGYTNQASFCDGYSDLYHSLYRILENFATARRDDLPMNAAQSAFVDVIEAAWAERALSGWLEASLLTTAAIHAAILADDPAAHDLHAMYATVGGYFDPASDSPTLEAALGELFTGGSPTLSGFLREGRVQTNECSRSLGWLIPAYVFSQWERDLSITLVDLGTSAGLNLSADFQHWDWRVDGKTYANGDQDFMMQPKLHTEATADPDLDFLRSFGGKPPLNIVKRVGVDRFPLDITNPDHRLALEACVWGDQPERLERLDRAIVGFDRMLGAGVTPEFFAGEIIQAAELLPRLLPQNYPQPHMLLVFNSAVTGYFSDADYDRLKATVIGAFNQLPADVSGIWIENEAPRFNEKVERDKHFMIKAHVPFMSGVSHFFLGEMEAHPQNFYIRAGWDGLRMILGWD